MTAERWWDTFKGLSYSLWYICWSATLWIVSAILKPTNSTKYN